MSVNIFGSQQNNRESSKQQINSKFISLSRLLQTKVNKSGDILEGELNMNNNKITNVACPSDNLDAVNKNYVDNKIGESENDITEMLKMKVNKSGDTIRGTIDMNHNRILNLGNPLDDKEAVNKNYVDIKIQKSENDLIEMLNTNDVLINRKLDMHHNRILNLENPSNGAVNKNYVDSELRNVGNSKLNKTDLAREIRNLTLYTLNEEGLIPHLTDLNDKSNWVVASNHPYTRIGSKTYHAYKLFENDIWKIPNQDAINSHPWISVGTIGLIRIYKFVIKPVENVTIKRWKIQGKVLDEWEDLLFDLEPIENNVIKDFTLENPLVAKPYFSYRILIQEWSGEDPGLSYWQLYAMSQVFIA